MSNSNPFGKFETLILQVTYKARRPMSIREMAKKADLSWVTCRKYAKDLIDRKWLLWDKSGKRKKVVFNFKRLNQRLLWIKKPQKNLMKAASFL